MTSVKEDEADIHAVEIIEKTLDILELVSSLFKMSTRAGGHVLQNFTMMATCILARGLQFQMDLVTNGAKSEEDKVAKSQHAFGNLFVTLASQILNSGAVLFKDLNSEVIETPDLNEDETLDLFGPYNATRRVAMLLKAVPFVSLLFDIAGTSYGKSYQLRFASTRGLNKRKVSKSSQQTASEHVTLTNMDDIEEDSYSEDEDDELREEEVRASREGGSSGEDSEPIFGRWFEETLCPPETGAAPKASMDIDDDEDLSTGNGDKNEPSKFISLASQVFLFMDEHLFSNDNKFIESNLKENISMAQVHILATITKNLDRETHAPKSPKMESSLASLYADFSKAVANVTHNLLASNILSNQLQDAYLSELNVCPWPQEGMNAKSWPLQLYPRTLSALAQILLLRQKQDGGNYSTKNTNVYATIWDKLLNSLAEAILSPGAEEDAQDFNVEHAQVLLFLFHALSLMQKKFVLLTTTLKICQTTVVVNRNTTLQPSQIRNLFKLVLLFEYLMKNLYEPPQELMNQVQRNVFQKYQKVSGLSLFAPPLHFEFKSGFTETEQLRISPMDQASLRDVKFFNLFNVTELSTIQEVPKLDGLALSFILATSDSLDYGTFYRSLINLVGIIYQADLQQESSSEALLATKNCFSLVWRTLQCLPPSSEFLESLVSAKVTESMEPTTMLHALILCPRMNHKLLGTWIKDSLVKQGQTTGKAENLLKNVSTTINQLEYDVKIFKKYLGELSMKAFLDQDNQRRVHVLSNSDIPDFVDLLVLDALMAKVQVAMDQELKGDKLSSDSKSERAVKELVPMMCNLLSSLLHCSKALVINSMQIDKSEPINDSTKEALARCLSVSSLKAMKVGTVSLAVSPHFVPELQRSLASWSKTSLLNYPQASSWRMSNVSEGSPFENHINLIIKNRINTLDKHNSNVVFSPNLKMLSSIKHCLYSAARFIGDLYVTCGDLKVYQAQLSNALFPLIMDGCSENLSELVTLTLQKLVQNTDQFQSKAFRHILEHTYPVLLMAGSFQKNHFSEKTLQVIVTFIDGMLDSDIGRKTLEDFFARRKGDSDQRCSEFDLVQILLTLGSSQLGPEYASKVLKLFNRLFEISESQPKEEAVGKLCHSLERLSQVPPKELENWLRNLVQGNHIIFSNVSKQYLSSAPDITLGRLDNAKLDKDQLTTIQDNRLLLLSLSRYIVLEDSPIPEEVAQTILKSLIPMGYQALSPVKDNMGFADLLTVMSTLAGAGSGQGHLKLLRACLEWQATCKSYLMQKDVLEKLEQNVASGSHITMVDNACLLLNYVSYLLS